MPSDGRSGAHTLTGFPPGQPVRPPATPPLGPTAPTQEVFGLLPEQHLLLAHVVVERQVRRAHICRFPSRGTCGASRWPRKRSPGPTKTHGWHGPEATRAPRWLPSLPVGALMLVGSRSSVLAVALPATPNLGLLPRDLPFGLPPPERPPAGPPVWPPISRWTSRATSHLGREAGIPPTIRTRSWVIHSYGMRAQEGRSAHPRTWFRPARWRAHGSARSPSRFPGRETCKCVRAGSVAQGDGGVTRR